MSQTTERAFETYVEAMLRDGSGWGPAPAGGWDVECALFSDIVLSFLRETQPELWSAEQAMAWERSG